MRFRLNDELLTVRLIPPRDHHPPDARRELWHKRVRAVCSPTFDYRRAHRTAVRLSQGWPRGRMKLNFRFRSDISGRAKWCLLEATDGRDIAGVQFEHLIRVLGTSAGDRRIGRELRRYLRRNVRHGWWYRRVKAIFVERQVIAVLTSLRRSPAGRRVAARLCDLIQGADVADFTPGHTIFGPDDVQLKVCPARTE